MNDCSSASRSRHAGESNATRQSVGVSDRAPADSMGRARARRPPARRRRTIRSLIDEVPIRDTHYCTEPVVRRVFRMGKVFGLVAGLMFIPPASPWRRLPTSAFSWCPVTHLGSRRASFIPDPGLVRAPTKRQAQVLLIVLLAIKLSVRAYHINPSSCRNGLVGPSPIIMSVPVENLCQ